MAASHTGGGGEWGEEITFYFDTMPIGDYYTLTAREGMTWADWVASEYNTIGAELYEYEDIHEVSWNGFIVCHYRDGTSVEQTEEIISEEIYGLI